VAGSVARPGCSSSARHDRCVDGPSEENIQRRLARVGLRANSCHITLAGRRRELAFVVSGRRQDTDVRAPEFLADFARQPGVLRLEWKALA
jgi:hypothetical protein